MKIIDCFIFYNELKMLTYRLSILYDIVDFFILVESNQTFMGHPKPLFYNENKHLFKKFEDKIIHIIVDLPYVYPNINYKNKKPFQILNYHENGEQWFNEAFQRESIKNGFENISLEDSDYIIVSDVDEILNPNTLNEVKKNPNFTFTKLLQDNYTYSLNYKEKHIWSHPYLMSYNFYKQYISKFDPSRMSKYIFFSKGYSRVFLNSERLCLNELRLEFTETKFLENGGWHLSFFGDEKFINNKYANFSHVEAWEENKIEKHIKTCLHIPIKSNNNLPPFYEYYLSDLVYF